MQTEKEVIDSAMWEYREDSTVNGVDRIVDVEPDAEVIQVDGGFWVRSWVWVPEHDK